MAVRFRHMPFFFTFFNKIDFFLTIYKKMSFIDKCSDKEFIKIVEETDTYTNIAFKLGFKHYPNSKNREKIKNRIEKLKLNISKFKTSSTDSFINNYSDADFIKIVKESYYLKEVAEKIGYNLGGRGVTQKISNKIKKRIKDLNIDTTHFKYNEPKKLEFYLVNNPNINKKCNQLIKKRLIEEKYLENKCHSCGVENKWKFYGEEVNLTLQLDHINGNPLDNRLENLRILCANCHSCTNTFSGRNRK